MHDGTSCGGLVVVVVCILCICINVSIVSWYPCGNEEIEDPSLCTLDDVNDEISITLVGRMIGDYL